MLIEISLHGVLRIDRFKQKQNQYPDGTCAQDIIEELGLPSELVGIILINGIHAKGEAQLFDGDKLTLLPLLDGG